MARWFAQLRHSKKVQGSVLGWGGLFCACSPRVSVGFLQVLCFPPQPEYMYHGFISSQFTDEDLDLVCSSLYIRHLGCDFFLVSQKIFFCFCCFLALNHFYLHLEEPICRTTPDPTFFPQCSRIVFALPLLFSLNSNTFQTSTYKRYPPDTDKTSNTPQNSKKQVKWRLRWRVSSNSYNSL